VQEIAPGIFHWSAFHEGIRMRVSSYYVEPAGVVIDPMVPDEGFEVFDGHEPPQQAILTIRHHYRACDEFRERFGFTVACSAAGLHEFDGSGKQVEGFRGGDEVAPGITAVATDGISPDDVTLHIAHGGALAFGDGLVRPPGGPLGFVPDGLIGDDPETVKAALYDAYRGLLERDFDSLLFAHGEPLANGGFTALKEFVSGS
jgi:glyoxylase-like metal-dependent hydrolase (beta-lactamase superfamily II)